MGLLLAAADFGSNKTGYIACDWKGGEFRQLERESRFTRLAEGVAHSGRINGEAVVRALLWCEEMRKRWKKLGVERVRCVGTEALRRASNQSEVCGLIEDVLGWPVEVISGEEEGRLTFRGVRLRYAKGPLAVIDVGGGSTELSLGGDPTPRGDEIEVKSMRIGAVVLTERHDEQWDALCRAVRAELSGFTPRTRLPEVLTVLGGTGANLTMMDLDDHDLKDEHVEGHVIELDRLKELRKRALEMTPKQRVEKLGLPPQRADVQIAGLAILETALEHLGLEAVRTSRYALRHGVLRSIAPKD
jgi:exopolyphosphatase/guanosine-5'-triphosphate,3'-diphosphate pyrophosphatase